MAVCVRSSWTVDNVLDWLQARREDELTLKVLRIFECRGSDLYNFYLWSLGCLPASVHVDPLTWFLTGKLTVEAQANLFLACEDLAAVHWTKAPFHGVAKITCPLSGPSFATRVLLLDLDETLGCFRRPFCILQTFIRAVTTDSDACWISSHWSSLKTWLRGCMTAEAMLRPGALEFLVGLRDMKGTKATLDPREPPLRVALFTLSGNTCGWVSLVMEALNDLVREQEGGGVGAVDAIDAIDAVVAANDMRQWFADTSAAVVLRSRLPPFPSPVIRKTARAAAWKLGLDFEQCRFVAVDDVPQLVCDVPPEDVIAVNPYLSPCSATEDVRKLSGLLLECVALQSPELGETTSPRMRADMLLDVMQSEYSLVLWGHWARQRDLAGVLARLGEAFDISCSVVGASSE